MKFEIVNTASGLWKYRSGMFLWNGYHGHAHINTIKYVRESCNPDNILFEIISEETGEARYFYCSKEFAKNTIATFVSDDTINVIKISIHTD
jgi:hypothetical protein